MTDSVSRMRKSRNRESKPSQGREKWRNSNSGERGEEGEESVARRQDPQGGPQR